MIEIGAPSLALLEDSNIRIHAFEKSWKKNPRSMPSHNPLLSDRTEDEDADEAVDEDADEAVAVAVVVENSPQKSANAVSTITFVSTAPYPGILLPIVPLYPTPDLVLISGHKVADRLSAKLIPFQKKEWRNCHSKMKAELISLPLTNSNHWSNSI